MTAALASGRKLGRFELLRQLGRGAQATVWLAHDARLDREVAVKLLDPQAAELQQWLHEARAVARLQHPNVVPVFEADTVAGQPVLVFEYVDGGTLADARRGKGPLPPREAVALMVGVLDALATAHAQGIVHRDLKPSNLLLAADGRARVMDFGIAVRMTGGGDGRIAGTPGYMSPEAARGEAPAPQMDVFAAGMVLGELLAGMPLLCERDPYRAIDRVQREDFALPPELGVDEPLRAIVARALARDPRQRYDGAASMRDALGVWLAPAPETADAAGGHATLEFLLRRMKHRRDFPALGESVVRIQHVASSETESLASLSAEVLKDVALTNKLLRMVNTVHFASAGAGNINTISRAVALVGFAGIRNMALSVILLEHMQDSEHATQIREEFLRGLMAGTLAAELSATRREAEEIFIAALFQNLGRMLAQYYFPEEAQRIRQDAKGRGMAAEDQAALSVLGLGYQALGVGIAKAWCLPDVLQRAMSQPEGPPPARTLDNAIERQRWIGRIANEITDAMLDVDDAVSVEERIGRVAEAFAPSLGLQRGGVLAATEAARARLTSLAEALSLKIRSGAAVKRLMAPAPVPVMDTLAPHQLAATLAAQVDDGLTIVLDDRPAGPPAAELLAAGVQDITNSMVVDGFKLNELLRMVLETMYRALGFRRIIFCLRDPKTDSLCGRFGLGDEVESLKTGFRIPLQPSHTPDLFSAVCAKGVDTLIADASVDKVVQRLPAWYRSAVAAPTFLLLPLAMKGRTFALIYADKAQAGSIMVDEKELSLLRTLRNQAVMAFRQLGG